MSSEEQTPGPAATTIAEPAMAKRSAEHLEEKPAPVETVTEPTATTTAASTSEQPVAKKIRTDRRDGEASIKPESVPPPSPLPETAGD